MSFNIIGRPYQGTHTLGNWQSDDAYDISMPVGTPMIAVANGVVTQVTHHPQDGSRFAGDAITIRTDDGNQLFYKHGVASVHAGQRVQVGDSLGTSGSASGSPHLHFAALKNPGQFLAKLTGSGGGGGVAGAVTGAVSDAAGAVAGAAGAIGGAVAGGAKDAAAGLAKDAVGALWDAVGEDGARALLYALLVFGGVALAVVGIARATGVGQKIRSAAQTAAKAGELAAIA